VPRPCKPNVRAMQNLGRTKDFQGSARQFTVPARRPQPVETRDETWFGVGDFTGIAPCNWHVGSMGPKRGIRVGTNELVDQHFRPLGIRLKVRKALTTFRSIRVTAFVSII
jgi:hypothetical protein